jgi:hypothetical protein
MADNPAGYVGEEEGQRGGQVTRGKPGAWMLLHGDADDEEEKGARLVSAHGMALMGLGISISLDELAIGFGLGLVATIEGRRRGSG